MKTYTYFFKYLAVGMLAVCGFLAGCTDTMERTLNTDYPEIMPDIEAQKGKVLWIIMDGGGGKAVNQTYVERKAKTIRQMTANSIYTFEGLADSETDSVVTKERGWANLMTGTVKHSVYGPEDLDTLSIPSVIQRLNERNASFSIALLASDDAFGQKFGEGADAVFCGNGSDASVQEKALQMLAEDSVADFMVLEFAGVRQAGEQDGFFTDETENTASESVTDAIAKLDGYIGEMLETLQQRPDYQKENWILMVSSGYGGSTAHEGRTPYDMNDRNVFAMMYSPRFSSRFESRPSDSELSYNFTTLLYAGSGSTDYAVVNDTTLFDVSFNGTDTIDYTVQFMYRGCSENTGNKDVSLVSKTPESDLNKEGSGWQIRRRYKYYRTVIGGEKNALCYAQCGENLDDKERVWHVITVVFDYHNQRMLQYFNGEYVSEKEFSLEYDHSTSEAPLTIGKIEGSSDKADHMFYITNLQFYNVALPADYIKKNHMLTHLEEKADSNPYWDNLIGYWPCDREEDAELDVLYDYSQYGSIFGGVNAGRSDMTISKKRIWQSGSVLEDNVQGSPDESYVQAVVNNVDFAYQTFQWFGLDVDNGWNWTGTAHALPYSSLDEEE